MWDYDLWPCHDQWCFTNCLWRIALNPPHDSTTPLFSNNVPALTCINYITRMSMHTNAPRLQIPLVCLINTIKFAINACSYFVVEGNQLVQKKVGSMYFYFTEHQQSCNHLVLTKTCLFFNRSRKIQTCTQVNHGIIAKENNNKITPVSHTGITCKILPQRVKAKLDNIHIHNMKMNQKKIIFQRLNKQGGYSRLQKSKQGQIKNHNAVIIANNLFQIYPRIRY